MVNIIRRIDEQALPYKDENDLYANEVMLLSYYIASLNIEHAYTEIAGRYERFKGLAFVDRLDMGEERQLTICSPENTERIKRQQEAEIMIIIGNPPYNVGQLHENDNNKNRQYPILDRRIRETYATDSRATLNNQLYDMYVRFFRWSIDRLQDRDGIICFVSNNSFLDGIAFDGFRKHLVQDFTHIYHFDFKGNARTSGKRRRQEGGNIFGDQIRVGVGITMLVRARQDRPTSESIIQYHRVGDYWEAEQKAAYLASFTTFGNVPWEILQPDMHNTWLTEGLCPEFETLIPMGTKAAKAKQATKSDVLFTLYGMGVGTNGDAYVYSYNRAPLLQRADAMVEDYMAQRYQWIRKGKPSDPTTILRVNEQVLKWIRYTKQCLVRGKEATFDEAKIRRALYRPFCKQYYYFERIFNEAIYQFPIIFPTAETEEENAIICVTAVGNTKPFHCLMTNCIADHHLTGDSQCFPFYTYNEDGTNRQENITDWALQQFQATCGEHVTKWDIFYYIYAVLHHPSYRERYAKNLQRDLPHIPLPTSAEAFTTLADHGKTLADLHIGYEQAPMYQLEKKVTTGGRGNWWRVEKMQLSRDGTQVIVNPWMTLEGIPAECFEYRLGNRSALEWVIEQYQVKRDSRSGIVNDPNRDDDETYIIDLVKRVVHVSVETVRIVREIGGIAVV